MAVDALSAAKALCEISGWQLSNLELQKILYIAEMLSLGETGAPLLSDEFEAWDYGPVLRRVYHHVKGFGAGPVGNVFHRVAPLPEGSRGLEFLRRAYAMTRALTPGQLVAFTHDDDGAWASVYKPGYSRPILRPSIVAEYVRRTRPA